MVKSLVITRFNPIQYGWSGGKKPPFPYWLNRFKIDVVITFLIEILELLNFGHMTTSTI